MLIQCSEFDSYFVVVSTNTCKVWMSDLTACIYSTSSLYILFLRLPFSKVEIRFYMLYPPSNR